MKTIALSKGQVTFVDDDDYERVTRFKWYANLVHVKTKKFRAARNKNEKNEFIYMHQFIMNARMVDHIDGDTLNNQKNNLRVCTNHENLMNTGKKRSNGSSKYKCVSWEKKRRLWEAYIKHNYRKKFLGYFENEVDAALAYDKAAIVLFGEFARLNFPK